MHKSRGKYTFDSSGATYAMVPSDLATIYNLNPLFRAGYAGQGQTIVLIEDTNVYSAADWTKFRSTFGLSGYSSASFATIHPAPSSGPNNCSNPGVIPPNDAEAILDAEWASASAPGATLKMASCADTTTTFGGLIALENLINSSSQPPAIMSISYGQCETQNGASANAAYYTAYQQAVAEGVSVFVAAGDSGAAGCDNSASQAINGIGANAFASTPYNVAVGGTDFSDTYSGTNNLYWNTTNNSTFGSALSYIPEIPWNNSCAGQLISNYEGYTTPYGPSGFCSSDIGAFLQTTVAGGGSPSGCATGNPSIAGVVSGSCAGWPKPSWQSILGNPNDGVRDTPDVSLFAADGLWGHYYVFCWSDTANGGAACTGAPSGWSGAGGTSFASPIMAGVQALINQKSGSRQGNPNPEYYHLAATEYSSNGSSCNSSNGSGIGSACIFNDITQGDMDVNCTGPNCYQGVLSTSNQAYNPAYGTGVGWDFATGIGSINAANLVNSWPNTTPGFTLSGPPTLTLTEGTSVTTTITINEQNGFGGSVGLSVSGLPAGVTASFSPNPATTSSVLTLTATSAAATGTVTLTINGTSGSLTNSTTITLAVTVVGNFTLSASPNSVSVVQGSSGTSKVTVTPQSGFTSSVSLSASGLPMGVTASFSPNPATGSSTMTLMATSTATTGTATVTVTGTVGGLTHTATVSVTITAGPNFTLSASPSSLGVPQGGSGITAITLAPQNGFSSKVTLSISGLPGGVTALFSPNPTPGSSTLTLMASSVATTGPATVTVTGTCGTLANSTTLSLTVFAASGFASGWLDSDVGAVGVAGGAAFSNGTFTVKGSGQQIWGNADSFNFVYQTLSGDGSIVARVVSLQGGTSVESAGAMIRETLTAGSTNAYAAFGNNALMYFDERLSTGEASTSASTSASVTLPYWVKLVRSGSTFGAYTSTDGVNWSQIGTNVTINMAQNVYIGLVVNSSNNSALATATFDNVSVSTPSAPAAVISGLSTTAGPVGSQVVISGTGFGATQGSSTVILNGVVATSSSWSDSSVTITIPTGASSGPLAILVAPTMNASNPVTFAVGAPPLLTVWLDQDIGQVGAAGSATYSNGTFTVKGSGQQIWGTADGLNFMYQPLSGDGTIVARVLSLQGGTSVESAGAMIRESLTAGSTNAYAAFGNNALMYFDERPSTGGASTSASTSASVTLPYWVKLVRSGSTFGGYTSADGVNWVQIGTNVTINMAQNVYIGLVVNSSNNSALATATFDNVSVSTPSAPAAVISGLSTTAGPVGSQVVISGTGFGATQSTSQVMLNGVALTINSWSNTSITATIPTGASSGTLAVLVAPTMNASNPVTFTVTVPLPDYSLAASPSSLNIPQGTNGGSTISVASLNGFTGGVSLSASGVPSGVTATFSSNPTSTSSTLTLTATSTATPGTATLTITGTSGSLTHATSLSVTVIAVPTFGLSASPSSLSLAQGTAGTSLISVAASNGFGGSVNLSVSGLPTGVSATLSANPTTTSSTLTLTASGSATLGTATVTVTGTSSTLTGVATISLSVTPQALLSEWQDQDVGQVGVAGNSSYASGTFSVSGSGQQIWGTADGLNFMYQPLSGDGTIVARVLSLQGGTSVESAGAMIRESLTAGSTNAYAAFGNNALMYFDERPSTGGASTSASTSTSVTLPYWVKLVRSGSTFGGYTSTDGVNWSQIGTNVTINMAQNVYIGLVVNSSNNSALATATFDNVSVSTPSAPAPAINSLSTTAGPVGTSVVISGSGFGATQGSSTVILNGVVATSSSWSDSSVTITIPTGATSGPLAVLVAPSLNATNPVTFTVSAPPLLNVWLDQDVGQVGAAGSVSYANGIFTLKGSGQQIWDTADGLNFMYQPLSGDGTIVARVLSLQGGTSVESAGAMIRESLTAGSTNAYAAFGNNALMYFDERLSTGGASTSASTSTSVTLPYWVKLVRSGSTFGGYTSTDGVNWSQIGTNVTINMAQNVYIGLVVNSSNNSALATATFDNVSVSTPSAPAPAINSLSTTAGPVGTSVVISGSGFGATQSTGTVMVSGVVAPVTAWSATSVTATIPTGATSGPLAVLVAPTMNASNPVTFTVP